MGVTGEGIMPPTMPDAGEMRRYNLRAVADIERFSETVSVSGPMCPKDPVSIIKLCNQLKLLN